MKKVLFAAILSFFAIANQANAQIYFTKQGKIHFYSKTKMEAIEASNKTVNAVLDASSGKIEFGVTVKGFRFEKALMEQHFNENYMESEKFPKATFKGKIDDLSAVNFSKDGTYNLTVTGDMTIHGVTKKMTYPGQIIVKGTAVTIKSKFDVVYDDFKIEIPGVVRENFTKSMACDLEAPLTLKK